MALLVQGMEAYGVRAFAEALEVIPSTLAENAGLAPISIVTQLRNRHAQGDSAAGINVRKVTGLDISSNTELVFGVQDLIAMRTPPLQ